jgi:uncharacterized protein
MQIPLPTPAPPIDPETKPVWDATLNGKLLIGFCGSCGQCHWYPRSKCPHCHAPGAGLREAVGTGSVYSYTVVRRGIGAYADASPFIVAIVELDEGPRMRTNIVGCDPESLKIGDRVQVEFHPTAGAAALPRFRPSEDTDARPSAAQI